MTLTITLEAKNPQTFNAGETWVARDADGHWRGCAAKHFAASAAESVATMFHGCEVGSVIPCGIDTATVIANF